MDKKLAGKRYIRLQRCSSAAQADTSIDDQRKVIEAFASHHGMIFVDEVVLEGVSGSVPGNRTDIGSLIQRKNERDDFDVLLVHDFSRLTRGGVEHAHSISFSLNSAGIELISATDSIPDGPFGSVFTSILSYSNQQHARAISQGATRGSMSSLLDDRSPYSRRPPYGIDREYMSADGTPLHIIRNLPDGTQIKLDPTTKTTIGRFDPNPKSGAPEHYRKQKQERIRLVPGDEHCQEIVRRIYERAFVDNLGVQVIATELNVEGIPSPTGDKWNNSTIGNILRNPIYRGEGIANRYSNAIYHMRSKDCPLPAQTNLKELYNRKHPPYRTRPREDWLIQVHPELVEFLPKDVRELAAVRQKERLNAQAEGRIQKRNRDRHRSSSFFLKGLLRSKQGDHPMTGAATGKKDRYYRISKAHSAPDGDSVLRKMIPAGPLEKAILAAVQSTLLNTPGLRNHIERQVRSTIAGLNADNHNLADLKTERADIQRKLKMIIDEFDESMKHAVQDKLTELKARLKSVDSRISKCQNPVPTDERAIQDCIEKSMALVRTMAESLTTAPPATLARYLADLIKRLEVDLVSREVILEIQLPASFDQGQVQMCLVANSVRKSGNEAHRNELAHLGVFRLVWIPKDRGYETHSMPTTLPLRPTG